MILCNVCLSWSSNGELTKAPYPGALSMLVQIAPSILFGIKLKQWWFVVNHIQSYFNFDSRMCIGKCANHAVENISEHCVKQTSVADVNERRPSGRASGWGKAGSEPQRWLRTLTRSGLSSMGCGSWFFGRNIYGEGTQQERYDVCLKSYLISLFLVPIVNKLYAN